MQGRETMQKPMHVQATSQSKQNNTKETTKNQPIIHADTAQPCKGKTKSFFFLIKCKKCIDQKSARQACSTSWKPAEHYMHQQREQTPLNKP